MRSEVTHCREETQGRSLHPRSVLQVFPSLLCQLEPWDPLQDGCLKPRPSLLVTLFASQLPAALSQV